jgi:hypothetical protein
VNASSDKSQQSNIGVFLSRQLGLIATWENILQYALAKDCRAARRYRIEVLKKHSKKF